MSVELISSTDVYAFDDEYIVHVTYYEATGSYVWEVFDNEGEAVENPPEEIKTFLKQNYPTMAVR